MSKFSFLVYHKDYQEFLEKVQELGVVHLIEQQKDVSDDIREKYDLVKQISGILKTLKISGAQADDHQAAPGGREAFEEAMALTEELEHKTTQTNMLLKEINAVKNWGDYSPVIIEKLREKDLHLKFYTVSSKKFRESWLEEYPLEVVGQHGGLTYFVILQQGNEEIVIEAEEMRPPEKPVSELNTQHEQLIRDLSDIQSRINRLAIEKYAAINQYRLEVLENIHFDKALENTVKEAADKVMLLEGWVPGVKKDALIEFLDSANVLYVESKPEKDEKVPVLLKNKKFSQKFEMVGELYSLPKYNELDLTPFFAPFYMLFFGFCLGDAGYGMLMVAASFILRNKVKKQMRTAMSLVFYLGLSTIFFGIIGGTAFGIPLYETNLPVYRTLAEKFAARDTDINQLLFYLALVFGGIQILFGMFLKVVNEVKQLGWGFAVGTIGWIILLIGGMALYLFSYVSNIPMDQLNTPLYVLLGVSGLLILPLNNLSRNIFMNVGVGLWNTYNMVTGILGDLLSYIRLFALGISSAIMGFVFNSLAVEMSGSIPVLNILIMIIILVVGHSINLFMAGLGAFVHPMRLTFVEFYKNAGFNGGGKQYNPFRKIT